MSKSFPISAFEPLPRWWLQPDQNQTEALLPYPPSALPVAPSPSCPAVQSCPSPAQVITGSLSVAVAFEPTPAVHPCPCAQPPCPIPLVGKAELYSSAAAPHPPLSVTLEPPLKAQDTGASGQPRVVQENSTCTILGGERSGMAGHLLPPTAQKGTERGAQMTFLHFNGRTGCERPRAQVPHWGVGQTPPLPRWHPFACLFSGAGLSLAVSCVPAAVLGSRAPSVSPDSATGRGGSDCVFGTNETLCCLGFHCIQEGPWFSSPHPSQTPSRSRGFSGLPGLWVSLVSPGDSEGRVSACSVETWVRFLGREDPLEKEMASHSGTVAWEISWTENVVGYSPWGRKELDTTEWLHFTSLLHFPVRDRAELTVPRSSVPVRVIVHLLTIC